MAYYKCGTIHPTQNSNVVVDTASGSIANFNTQLSLPLIETSFGVNAVQDLHGQSGAYPAGGGKNLFPPKEVIHDGVTLSLRPDGGVNINGRCSAAFNATVKSDIKAGTYSLSCRFTGTLPTEGAARAQIYHQSSGYSKQISNPDASESYTTCIIAEDLTNVEFRIRISANFTYQNVVYYPQFESGSSLTSFAPYSNICPINGADTVKLTRCGKNLVGIKPFSEWDSANYYYVSMDSVPNKKIYATFIDKDPTVDLSGISFGFVDSKWDKTSSLTTMQYRWIIQTGVVQNIKSNTAAYDAQTILTGLIIYPKSEAAYNKIFARYDIMYNEVEDAPYEPYNGSTTVIQLGNTYYGGRFIQDKYGKRKFEVTCVKEHFDLSGVTPTSANGFDSWIFNLANNATSASSSRNKLCDALGTYAYDNSSYGSEHFYLGRSNLVLYFKENTFRNGSVDAVYPLAEPITIDLPDGTPFKSLPGVNNIFADTGDTAVKFRKIGE